MIFYNKPAEQVIMASCDSKYFLDHAIPFVKSATHNGHNTHINIIDATYDAMMLAKELREYANFRGHTFSYTTQLRQMTAFKDMKYPEELRTYYACSRFLLPVNLFNKDVQDLLILDIDCVILKHVGFPKYESIGLFLRDPLPGTVGWEQESTKVAAGIVFLKNNAVGRLFSQELYHDIHLGLQNNPKWFLDQKALNDVYTQNKNYKQHTFRYTSKEMDWEPGCSKTTMIMTGKGDRKYSMQEYLEVKAQYS